MPTADVKLVFMSYATPDRERVLPFYEFLVAHGVDAWIDVKKLLPGQHWESEIRKALDRASLVTVFISENSVDRTGYVQKEMRIALEKLQERPLHQIYLIPVVLDRAATYPEQLKDLQYLSADDPECHPKLLESVNHQLKQAGLARAEVRRESEIEWTFGRVKEEWEGLPGYEIDVTWPIYRSNKYENIGQAGDIVKGEIKGAVARERHAK